MNLEATVPAPEGDRHPSENTVAAKQPDEQSLSTAADSAQHRFRATVAVPQITADMAQIDAALALAAVGIYVFSVDHPELSICAGIGKHHDPFDRPDHQRGKHPCVVFSEKATIKEQVIRAYWSQGPRNIGINCGKSNLVVIDEDKLGAFKRYADEHGVKIPPTMVVATAKGRHYYFLARDNHPLGNKEGAFQNYSINIRAGNGYVVGPGSIHATGVVYRLEVPGPPAPIPDWVIAGIAEKTASPNGKVETYGPGGLNAVPDIIRGPRADGGGRRHTELVRYASSLRARSVPYAEAVTLLRAVWERCEQPPVCTTPLPWGDALGKLDDVYERYDEGPSAEYRRDTTSSDGQADPSATPFDLMVADEVRRIQVRERARALVDAAKRPPAEPFDAGTLREMLARPQPPRARVDGLIPWEASTLIPAQRKTGKTTLLLNLSRSLLTGEPFLGTFGVRPVDGLVAFLNYEVSGDTLTQWADETGLDPDRFFIVNLRGRRNPLADPEDRARFAELLRQRGTESLLVDPFGRSYTGKSQNDPAEVGSWLIELDRFTRTDVGAQDLILTTHAGWNQERTRGSSALEDWADSIITMTRDDSEDGDGERYIRAIGRDVDLEEDQLNYDPNTRTLTLTGSGSRKANKDTRRGDKLDKAALDLITAKPGLNTSEIERALREAGVSFQRGDIGPAAGRLVEMGHLRLEYGKRGAKQYSPTENLLDDPQ